MPKKTRRKKGRNKNNSSNNNGGNRPAVATGNNCNWSAALINTDSAAARQTNDTRLLTSKLLEQAKGLVPPRQLDVKHVVLSNKDEKVLMCLVELLVKRNAVPDHLKPTFDNGRYILLTQRLKEIWFCNPEIEWLRKPFLNAVFASDGDGLNQQQVIRGSTRYSFLLMFSQYKMLHRQYGYMGGDEMVEIVLRLGADPNSQLSNNVNCLFLAVKYASAKTVQLLLDAGCDAHAKDCFGRTCLYNATERCNPAVVSKILEHLPATEIFYETNNLVAAGGPPLALTAPDRVVNNYTHIGTIDSGTITDGLPTSWRILGKPEVADICHTLLLLRRKGGELSPDTLELIGHILGEGDVHPSSTLNAFREEIKTLARSIVGLWLPPAIHDELLALQINANLCISEEGEEKEEIDQEDDQDEDDDVDNVEESIKTCHICVDDATMNAKKKKNKKKMLKRSKPVTLYCGHTFCWKCIYDYGHAETVQIKLCPICRRLLCLEVSSRPICVIVGQLIGNRGEHQGGWGPNALTNEQVKKECTSRKIPTSSLSSSNWEDLREKLDLKSSSSTVPSLDLGISMSMVSGETSSEMVFDTSHTIVAPKHGKVAIPITLKGVHILAFISSKSPLTVLSPLLVETFGLRRKNLKSQKFRQYNGTKLKNVTAIDEFEFMVGTMRLKINSAIEISPAPNFLGIQLGWDFINSLAYCTFDVELNVSIAGRGQNSIYMRSDGFGGNNLLLDQPVEKEEMRLYGRNGESYSTPLLHFKTDIPGALQITTVNLKEDQKFVECWWCCRMFPEDMLFCVDCSKDDPAYYCDKECQLKAWSVHRRIRHCSKKD